MNNHPSLTQWLASQQLCPRCRRAFNVEHVGVEEAPCTTRHYGFVLMFCDDCNRGFEVLFERQAGVWCRQFGMDYGPDETEDFAKFRARLANATVVAA